MIQVGGESGREVGGEKTAPKYLDGYTAAHLEAFCWGPGMKSINAPAFTSRPIVHGTCSFSFPPQFICKPTRALCEWSKCIIFGSKAH